jgi:predicted nucleotidyltransferase/HEPN domain-containing protein
MKIDIKFLPTAKQQELHVIVQAIRQHSEVEMIILFGSYAKGKWVEEYAEDGVHIQYQSDYDLLIIVKTRSTSAQHRLECDIITTIQNMPEIKTPVSPIVHDTEFVNRRLEKAQYFFSDIKKQGIVLYDSGQLKLKEPRELNNKERYQLAKEDYEYWFPKAKNFYEGFNFYLSKQNYSEAAFSLHQVAERLYTTLLLVFTRYKPNTHDLKILRRLINALDQRLLKVFPLSNSEERYRFILLCNAYVDARYKKSYTITESELTWLAERLSELRGLTEDLCQEKINSFLDAK